jgi:hypothetical protein
MILKSSFAFPLFSLARGDDLYASDDEKRKLLLF